MITGLTVVDGRDSRGWNLARLDLVAVFYTGMEVVVSCCCMELSTMAIMNVGARTLESLL